MEIQRAKELLEILADGIDPLTGEVLPDDHVCNKGEIVRALHCAVEEMSRRRKRPLPAEEASPGEQWKAVDGGAGQRAVPLVR